MAPRWRLHPPRVPRRSQLSAGLCAKWTDPTIPLSSKPCRPDGRSGAGEPYSESNHGYCKSIYVSSPDGLVVEFTQDPEDVAEIDAIRRADAHSELARWMAGDRRTNNELRGRAF